MAYILDTSVAIDLRDAVTEIEDKVVTLRGGVSLSVITRIELEGGVLQDETDTARRRARLDILLDSLPVLPFGTAAAEAYRMIIEAAGFSRRKIVDRMIAAQALASGAALVTRNAADFRDIPNLKLLEW